MACKRENRETICKNGKLRGLRCRKKEEGEKWDPHENKEEIK